MVGNGWAVRTKTLLLLLYVTSYSIISQHFVPFEVSLFERELIVKRVHTFMI